MVVKGTPLDRELAARRLRLFEHYQSKFERLMFGALVKPETLPPGVGPFEALCTAYEMASNRYIFWPEV